jgi:glutaredoxin
MKVYTTKTCAYCSMVKKFLTGRGVEFETIELDDKPELRQQLLELTGAMTVPITENNGRYVIGWNPGQLASII